jgi:NADH-quinone oxidoreductase subunit C
MIEKIKNISNVLVASNIAKYYKVFYYEHEPESVTLQCQNKINLTEIVQEIKSNTQLLFDQLIDICGVDYLGKDAIRYEVVYHFLSMRTNTRLRLRCKLSENETIESLTNIFENANWYERETYDMYGITFNNHPNLTRILTDYGFEGYPLQKDFPLTGHVQIKYDNVARTIVQEPVFLEQAYRNFEFNMPLESVRNNVAKSQEITNIVSNAEL